MPFYRSGFVWSNRFVYGNNFNTFWNRDRVTNFDRISNVDRFPVRNARNAPLATIGLQGPLEEAEERRLAGTIAAQEAHLLAWLNRQSDLVQDRRAAEAQVDVGQRDQWHPWMIESA